MAEAARGPTAAAAERAADTAGDIDSESDSSSPTDMSSACGVPTLDCSPVVASLPVSDDALSSFLVSMPSTTASK